MRNRLLPIFFVLTVIALVAVSITRFKLLDRPALAPPSAPVSAPPSPSPSPSPSASPQAQSSPTPSGLPSSNPNADLSVDDSGLSKATAQLTTSQGLIRFKFYTQDAPNTVKRVVELINQGFYNGLSWHRVVPGFVVQGGDPQGTGMGGSGQKLKAEFNQRHHVEGTLAMARSGSDNDSADSQFYISLGTFPHLDHQYTIFGQVVEGIDVARKLRVGDKIQSITLQ